MFIWCNAGFEYNFIKFTFTFKPLSQSFHGKCFLILLFVVYSEALVHCWQTSPNFLCLYLKREFKYQFEIYKKNKKQFVYFMFCNMYILVSSQGSLFIWPESIKFSFFPGAVAIFVNIFMNKITAARFCYIHFIIALYKFWGPSCFSDHLKFWSLASTLLKSMKIRVSLTKRLFY